uniref:SBP-type domain-containing protein n=1 Tax=Musa acuminata subsp. malaccensis TaxID=214687 RepID=A0A804J9U8_MUSAM|nr:PREDICTED: squamosa promoter-binding-like protein 9 isoform X1 [Musa acuminata subsp. malaccensis]
MEDQETVSGVESIAAAFEWGGLLDFAVDHDEDNSLFPPWTMGASDSPMPPLPPHTATLPLVRPPSALAGEGSALARKRDPRFVCSNFVAGRTPCSCPAEKEDAGTTGAAGSERKRARKARAAPVAACRCQVPRCEADIGELKGYHRRHRVCLRCACASSVVLDGESKRYCQQCGKFHMLSDFDEGKRSCRRKLEHHNKRRRRRHADSISMTEQDKEPQKGLQPNECGTEMLNGLACQTDEKVVTDKLIERNVPFESDDGYDQQTNYGSGFLPFATSDETQNEEKADNSKSPISSTLCNSKSAYSSVCPTGRISFKLYDWNPAEFPRQLRHQVFKWLSSMPVELEGYIRPGCTILTIFIAMPEFMWEKLSQNAVSCIRYLVYAPDSLLIGRGNIHIYLCNTIVQILEDQTSLMSTRMEVQVPRLHYVYPTFFEAGQPVEFIACGSNINQPKFRFFVSFAGKYLGLYQEEITPCKVNDMDSLCHCEHQMFRINIPQTDSDIFGPAFIEVENKLGISNFVPILFGNKLICSEFEKIYRKICDDCCLDDIYRTTDADATSRSCKSFVSKQTGISALLLDFAWVLRNPVLEKREELLSSTNIWRLMRLSKFLLQMESFNLLEVVLHYLDGINLPSLKCNANDTWDDDWCLFLNYMNQAREILSQRRIYHMRLELGSENSSCRSDFSQSDGDSDKKNNVLYGNQDTGRRNKDGDKEEEEEEEEEHDATPVLMSERGQIPNCHPKEGGLRGTSLTRKTAMHVAVLVAVSAVVCFSACLALFHLNKVEDIALFLKRRLFDKQQP